MSAPVTSLLREDLRDFAGYSSARREGGQGSTWLNANESPWPNPIDVDGALRRYPEPQPDRLRGALAGLYGCRPGQLLAGRGSDEAIDLLVRALCRPGRDPVLVTPPTFGMYAVAARLHGVEAIDVPLVEGEDGFACDFDAVAAAAGRHGVKLVFLCSPGNPTGHLLPAERILELAERLDGRALVVVDEAYIEFAQADSLVGAIDARPNVAVLRTLSKAHALAGLRMGCVIADAGLVAALQRCQAPYPLPEPCVQVALGALEPSVRAATAARVETLRREREWLARVLTRLPGVRRVYPSHGNFLLVRFEQAEQAWRQLLAAGIVVRDLRRSSLLGDALRLGIGNPDENEAVVAVLRAREAA